MVEDLREILHAIASKALIAGIALFLACAPAAAEPGLWLAKGPQSTIYFFGTVHVLRKNLVWESPRIEQALASSQELWLEVPDPDDTQAAQALVAQLGFDRAHPLSSKLSAGDLAHLDAAAKAVGVPDGEKTLEPMRPWLASVALEEGVIVRAGYDPKSGVEQALLRDQTGIAAHIRGFETLDQQLHFFANLNPTLELQMLQNTLQDFDQGPQKIDALVDAWIGGNDAEIARLMVDELKVPFPELYRTLLVQRNEAWAETIAGMIKTPGVRFIAVGAAHLAGPDSVQNALARRGVRVLRVNPPLDAALTAKP